MKPLVDELYQAVTGMLGGQKPVEFAGGRAAALFGKALRTGRSREACSKAIALWVSERPYNKTVASFHGRFSELLARANGAVTQPPASEFRRGSGALATPAVDAWNGTQPKVWFQGRKRTPAEEDVLQAKMREMDLVDAENERKRREANGGK